MRTRIWLAALLGALMLTTLGAAIAFADDTDNGSRRPLPCMSPDS